MKTKQNYTILEMLVVVFIMMVIMLMTLPAINSNIFSTKLDQAQSSLEFSLKSARNLAIKNNCTMAIVFPNYQESDYQNDPELNNSFRIIEVENMSITNNSTNDYVINEKVIQPHHLRQLPQAIKISYIGRVKNNVEASNGFVQYVTYNGVKTPAIIFRRNGRLSGLQQYIHLAKVTNGRVEKDNDMRMLQVNQYNGCVTIIDPETINYSNK